ncbi:nucleotidylyl transferase superfamily protein [Artemisia annua]|uniref:tryptophan--tRNA ligase n=1 Tax=Artemisia annua TaxID=35608 RepID=A0A2U1KS51_ARTAN|nr:nucleotidylyl transferase superfamily protein [Artemisia annua]
MGRTLVSQFLNLSNACPRFTSYGTSTKLQRRLPMIHENHLPVVGRVNRHQCYCSVSATEPTVTETSSTSVKKRIVSGVQPTGSIHLGNYLGAIKNWVSLQDKYETLFFIVDLHAITLPYDVQQLSKATRDTAALYLACGIDTSKASVFVQSHVRAHVELMWLLSSATPIGWLNRMIQFKEKSRKVGDENVGVALLTYPVLMASDILLYQSDLVPVGEDQKQHLELTRELAERVNHLYGGRKWKKLGGRGGSIFKVPEPLIPPAGARVMSLTDGLSKMSKSAPSDQSRINLLDSKDAIANKIKRCKTDSFPGLEFDNADRPECNNLLSIYQIITNKTKEEVAQEVQDMSWGTFKPVLTDALIDHLQPIQTRYEEIISDTGYLDQVLAEGASKASDIADKTLADFVKIPLERAGGIMNMIDIYCLFNRARGTGSPSGISPVMLKKFESGVMVIQSKSHSDEEVFSRIRSLVQKPDALQSGISATDAARTLGIAPAMAKEHLLAAESKGNLGRPRVSHGKMYSASALFFDADTVRFGKGTCI